MSTDPYAALGLTKTASADAIKKAYRKIAKTSHPDLNPGNAKAEARFKAASAAYDLLKDPATRARFDRGEIDATGAEKQPERKFYRDYAEAPQNPYRPNQPNDDWAGDFTDTSDIFAEFMRQQQARGGGRTSSQGFQSAGQDLRYALDVDFLDAANGGKTRITLPDGTALEVTIPKGTSDGQTIRLRGKGGSGFQGGPNGDAYITLSLRPHPHFTRDGNDVLVTLPITLDEAVLGGKVTVPTIGGPVNLTIPKGASSGQTLRLRGRGILPRGGKTAGDQRVELRIVSPPEIDDALATFMESWRKSNTYNPRKGMNP